MESIVRVASFAQLNARTAYELCRLRVDVFVVEQQCPYAELDGRDIEPGTRHFWLDRHGHPVAYLRLLREADGVHRIGRVCVAPPARGDGLAATLMRAAVAEIGPGAAVLAAQAPLASWYERFGFQVSGRQFLEDGIAHIPMRRG